jgi:hypothetical protein
VTEEKPNSFEVTERHQKGDKSGYHVFTNTPDFWNAVNADVAEFIYKANLVLRDFRDQWRADHEGEWSQSLEMDIIPVMSEGMVTGFLGISEISGDTYDWLPAKNVEVDK